MACTPKQNPEAAAGSVDAATVAALVEDLGSPGRGVGRLARPSIRFGLAASISTLCAPPCFDLVEARAELPRAEVVLGDVGYSAGEIARIKAGNIVAGRAAPAHERDLAVAFAFFVPIPPVAFVHDLRADLLGDSEPDPIARGEISGHGLPRDLASLTLQPDATTRAKRYVSAHAGLDLNLSAEEIATFNRFGSTLDLAAVEEQLRLTLLDRYRSYRAKGLEGIAPYAREGGPRSPSNDLRASLQTLTALRKYAPAAYGMMLDYPAHRSAGVEEVFSWTQFKAHGVPTIALVHAVFVVDGGTFLIMQRQYYVSEGFNCEQAVIGLLPVEGGTVVVYSNHTSTDQVTGLGGRTKRSIGSRLMSTELRAMLARLQEGSR